MSAEFWDERYSKDEYVYGETPNKYFADKLKAITPGKILMPADGEGRNSVYAAELGWDVYAFDLSFEGKRKAEQLAGRNGVTIHYEVADADSVQYSPGEFDAMALIFAHFDGKNKIRLYKKLSTLVKKGGIVIFEAYSKNHLKYNSINPSAGGPRDITMLFSEQELKDCFADFEIIEINEEELELWEGTHHGGMSAVMRFVGRKL